ncbi:MAG: peptidoglycan binding domain-containing protein, partial [Candidatus Doudnabacteria bacterium]|nr:peptidoglycan binding domain-containing protein [Candidatus Doudnabacteria bacterium]
MARKKIPEPEIVVENLSTPSWLSHFRGLSSRQKIEIGLGFVGIILLFVGLASGYSLFHYFDQRFLPGTQIDGLNLSGLTRDEALTHLQRTQSLTPHTLQLSYEGQTISSSSAQLQAYRDLPQALDEARHQNQEQTWWKRLQIIMCWQNQPLALESKIRYNTQALNELLELFNQQVKVASTEPHATLTTSGNVNTLKIVNGSFGRELNQEATRHSISQAVSQLQIESNGTLALEAQIASTGAQLSETELTAARERATKFVGKKITWSGADQRLHLTDQDLVKLLTFPQGFSTNGQQDILEKW